VNIFENLAEAIVAAGAALAGAGLAAYVAEAAQLQRHDRVNYRRLRDLQAVADEMRVTISAGRAIAVHRWDSAESSLGGMILRLHLIPILTAILFRSRGICPIFCANVSSVR